MSRRLLLPVLSLLLLAIVLAYTWPGRGRLEQLSSSTDPKPDDSTITRRVLIVSVDGLRPDLLLRARAPNMRALMNRGSFTFWAQTVKECYTLPSHVSMFTGVTPDRHGVTWNNHIEGAYPKAPTLFTLARKAGWRTAMAVGKTKFVALTPPESLDWAFQPMDEPIAEDVIAARAVDLLRLHRPHVLFVHFPGPDNAGHAHGWGSAEQMISIAQADAALGSLLRALDGLKLRESTLIILTADHGGAGREHGPDDPRSRHIPWIAAGPGVQRNFDLTSVPGLTVRIEDTFATAVHYLGLPLPAGLDGKPVTAIYEPTPPPPATRPPSP